MLRMWSESIVLLSDPQSKRHWGPLNPPYDCPNLCLSATEGLWIPRMTVRIFECLYRLHCFRSNNISIRSMIRRRSHTRIHIRNRTRRNCKPGFRTIGMRSLRRYWSRVLVVWCFWTTRLSTCYVVDQAKNIFGIRNSVHTWACMYFLAYLLVDLWRNQFYPTCCKMHISSSHRYGLVLGNRPLLGIFLHSWHDIY